MILKAILIAIAAAAASFLVSRTQIFERPRKWVEQKSDFFGDLVTCNYCLGHWMTAGLMAIMPVAVFGTFRPLDYFLTWLVISWVAGMLSMLTGWLWGE